MNYGELKTNLKALAFEEEETITEYIEDDVIPTAINRAISIIGERVMPIIKTYEIEQDGTDEEYLYYDFTTLVKDFLAFDANPVRIDDGTVYKVFGDYEIERGDTIVIDGSIEGTFKVFYKAEHTPYVADGTMEDVQIPLKRRVHHLVPLLAAYYVWLDDDAAKATQYYNQYEISESNIIADVQKPKMRVITDWSSSGNALNAFPNVSKDEWGRYY